MLAVWWCLQVNKAPRPPGHRSGIERMRISFERTGGFAGMRITGAIDSDALLPEEKQNLLVMVNTARFFDLPQSMVAEKPTPDRFQYKLTIVTESQQHTVRVDEEVASKELRALLSRLATLARRK